MPIRLPWKFFRMGNPLTRYTIDDGKSKDYEDEEAEELHVRLSGSSEDNITVVISK